METFLRPPIKEIYQGGIIRRYPLGTVNITLEAEIQSCQTTIDILAVPVQQIIGPYAVYSSTKDIIDDEYFEPQRTIAPNISIGTFDKTPLCTHGLLQIKC